jgi:hypothetical protein
MADRRQIHKALVLAAGLLAATATLTAGAAFLSVAPADQSEATAVLGAEWQCRNMMLFTSCTRARHIEPAAQRLGRDMARVRRV